MLDSYPGGVDNHIHSSGWASSTEGRFAGPQCCADSVMIEPPDPLP